MNQQPSIFSPEAPLWSFAFRPLFLLASAISVVSLLLWTLSLNGQIQWTSEMPSSLWHVHEMLFGFALTVAAGFLLTAVQNWTSLRSLHGYGLMALVALWLAIRVVLLLPEINLLVILSLQAMWWALMIGKFSHLVLSAQSERNYKIIVLLLIISTLHLCFLFFSLQGEMDLALHLARAAILFFTVIITLIAGRIMAMFTRNGVNRFGDDKAKLIVANIKPTDKIDNPLLYLSGLVAVMYLLNGFFPQQPIIGFDPVLFLILPGLLHLYRNSLWAPLATVKIPLLWSLQLSYIFLGISLIVMGISPLIDSLRFADALHLLTIGTIGGMILAMISRVSLGHTGRLLQVGKLMAVAYGAVFIAALIRTFLPMLGMPLESWNLSAGLWIIGFGIFLVKFVPVLTSPRADAN